MSEPTIDEMLEWFDSQITFSTRYSGIEVRDAIRDILKQHRDPRTEAAIIRAFAERVDARFVKESESALWKDKYTLLRDALLEELAASEKELP